LTSELKRLKELDCSFFGLVCRNYNESKQLGLVIYNLGVSAIVRQQKSLMHCHHVLLQIMGALIYLLKDGSGSPTANAIFVLGSNYVLLFTMLGLNRCGSLRFFKAILM
jgi:hypothetical protein